MVPVVTSGVKSDFACLKILINYMQIMSPFMSRKMIGSISTNQEKLDYFLILGDNFRLVFVQLDCLLVDM